MEYRERASTYYLPDGTSVEWFSPRECIWDRQQVKWILAHLGLLKAGYWPPDSTGRESVKTHKKTRRAYFEVPVEIATEVEARLDRTGRDGLFCLTFYHGNISQDRIAQLERMPVEEVGKRISRVIRYISGWSRKERSYEEFVQHKKHKDRKSVV